MNIETEELAEKIFVALLQRDIDESLKAETPVVAGVRLLAASALTMADTFMQVRNEYRGDVSKAAVNSINRFKSARGK